MVTIEKNPNAWRAETPGHDHWPRTARPEDPNKYFIVSVDCMVKSQPTSGQSASSPDTDTVSRGKKWTRTASNGKSLRDIAQRRSESSNLRVKTKIVMTPVI